MVAHRADAGEAGGQRGSAGRRISEGCGGETEASCPESQVQAAAVFDQIEWRKGLVGIHEKIMELAKEADYDTESIMRRNEELERLRLARAAAAPSSPAPPSSPQKAGNSPRKIGAISQQLQADKQLLPFPEKESEYLRLDPRRRARWWYQASGNMPPPPRPPRRRDIMAEALAACQVGEHAARLTPMKRGQDDVEDDLEECEVGGQRGSSTKKRKTPLRLSCGGRQLEEGTLADGDVLDVERGPSSSSSSSSFTEKMDRGVDVEQRGKGGADDKGVPWALGVAGLKHTTSTSRDREECEDGLSSSPVEISDVRSLWKAREEVAKSGGTTMEMSVCSSIAWVSPRTKRLTMGEAADNSSSSPKIVGFDRPGGWISPRQKRRSSNPADSKWNMTVKVADGLGFWDAPPVAVSRGKDKSHGLLVSGAIEDGGGAFLSASMSGGAAENDGGEGRGEGHASVPGSVCQDSSSVLEVVGGEHHQQHLETNSLAAVGAYDDELSLREGCDEQLSSSGSSIVQVPLKYRAVEAAKEMMTASMTLQLNKQPPRHVPEIASPSVRVLERGEMDSASSSPMVSSPAICCGTPMSRGTPMSLASPCVENTVDSSVADSVADDKSTTESPGAFFRSLLVQGNAGKRGGKRTGLRTSFSRRRGGHDVHSVENGGAKAASAAAPSPSVSGVAAHRPDLFASPMPPKGAAPLDVATPGAKSSAAASLAGSEPQAAVHAVIPGDSDGKLSFKAPPGDGGRKADFTPKRPRSEVETATEETPKRRRGDVDADDVDGLLGGVSSLNLQSRSPLVAACSGQEDGTQRPDSDAVSTADGQVAGDGEALAVLNSSVPAVEEVQETAGGDSDNGGCNGNVAGKDEEEDSMPSSACNTAAVVDAELSSSNEVEASPSSSSSSTRAPAVVVEAGAGEKGLAPSAEILEAAAGCEIACSTGTSTASQMEKESVGRVGTPMGNKWEGCAVEMLLETLDTLASAMSPYPANNNSNTTAISAASASNAPIVASSTPRPSAAPVSATKFLPKPSPSVAATPTAAPTIKAPTSVAKADAPGSATLRPVKQSPFDGKRIVGDDDDLPRPTFEVLKVLEGEGMAPPPRIELMIGGNGDAGGGAGVGWVSPRTKKLQGGDLSKGGSGQVVKKGLRVLRESAMNTRKGCR